MNVNYKFRVQNLKRTEGFLGENNLEGMFRALFSGALTIV